MSDAGRIRYEQDRGGRYRVRAGDIAAQSRDGDGYNIINLARIGERTGRVVRRVNRLVALAFLGPVPFEGAQVNHKNGCHSDDAADNLEWATARENVQHAIHVLGRDLRGPNSASAKLTTAQVLELRERAARGELFSKLASDYGITNVAAAQIATGQTWVNVGGPLSPKRDAAERRRLGIPNR